MDEINEWLKRELALHNEIEDEKLFYRFFMNIVKRDCEKAKQKGEANDDGHE